MQVNTILSMRPIVLSVYCISSSRTKAMWDEILRRQARRIRTRHYFHNEFKSKKPVMNGDIRNLSRTITIDVELLYTSTFLAMSKCSGDLWSGSEWEISHFVLLFESIWTGTINGRNRRNKNASPGCETCPNVCHMVFSEQVIKVRVGIKASDEECPRNASHCHLMKNSGECDHSGK